MLLNRAFRGFANSVALKWRTTFNIRQKLKVGNSTIILPPDHFLTAYQASYVQYDRFLPHLVKHLERGSVVIDVGANVGDTVAAMITSNDKLRYVCVEADDEFFEYLIGNAKALIKNNPNVVIDSYKCLIGLSVKGVKLLGVGGTKHAEVSDDAGALTSKSLDVLIAEINCEPISLIKSDVDGYDYDVINSAQQAIVKNAPLLYFECQHGNESQFNGYKDCLERIEALGYKRFAIFDNFGGLVADSVEQAVVFEFMKYVRGQNDGSSARTIHYIDILAYKPEHASLVSSVLSNY